MAEHVSPGAGQPLAVAGMPRAAVVALPAVRDGTEDQEEDLSTLIRRVVTIDAEIVSRR
jgi:hypothetical protein